MFNPSLFITDLIIIFFLLIFSLENYIKFKKYLYEVNLKKNEKNFNNLLEENEKLCLNGKKFIIYEKLHGGIFCFVIAQILSLYLNSNVFSFLEVEKNIIIQSLFSSGFIYFIGLCIFLFVIDSTVVYFLDELRVTNKNIYYKDFISLFKFNKYKKIPLEQIKKIYYKGYNEILFDLKYFPYGVILELKEEYTDDEGESKIYLYSYTEETANKLNILVFNKLIIN